MASNNGSAEIVNMEDARARRRAGEPQDFPSTGAYLQAVREVSGLTLEDVAERTHIKAVFLEAIETMALKTLPARPFAIGFVRVYAEALGLEADQVVSRFKTDAGWAAPAEIEHERFEAVHAAAEDADRPHLSLIAVLAVTLFILWCAVQIATTTHDETEPFNLAGESAAGREAIVIPAPASPVVRAVESQTANVVEPRLADAAQPIYPTRCELGAGPVETVEVAFNVTTQGVVVGARVASSSSSCFNDAALNAIRRWRFTPRTVDGVARPAYDQRYTFRFERPV